MPAPPDLHGRSLLAVFAHPDDESLACGGTLAWCAHLGADVSLLCMTHGEHGPGRGEHGPGAGEHGPGAEDVRRTRGRELESAARALGVHAVTLLDHEDGMLPWLPAAALRSAVEREVRARRPEVLVTFDADGLYWHPDHVAVHEAATAAVARLGGAAPALYYVTMPPGSMRAVADHAAAAANAPASRPRSARDPGGTAEPARPRKGDHSVLPRSARDPGGTAEPARPRKGDHSVLPRSARDPGGAAAPARPRNGPATRILGVADPDAFGSAAPPPTLVIDAGRFAARKLAALACHASQFRGGALARVGERDTARLLGVEHYRRAGIGAAGRTFLDDLGSCPAPAEGPRGGGVNARGS